MESFTKQLNLLDIPPSVCNDIISFYQHCTNSTQNEICNIECCFNDTTKKSLIKNLIDKPFETSCVAQQLQDVFKEKHSRCMENIFSSAVINYLQQFSEDTQSELDVKTVYTLLSLIEFCDQNDNILDFIFTQVYDLIEEGKLNKDLVYMTLLPQKNLEIITRLLTYERQHFDKCYLNDTTSLFRYCLYKNRHWLFHIIENDSPDTNLIEANILHKIRLLKILYTTNDEKLMNYESIEAAINKISRNDIQDKFLEFYYSEIKWNLQLYRLLSKINKTIIPKNQFKLSTLEPCLITISSFIDLRQIDKYKEINDILMKYEKYMSELETIKLESKLSTNFGSNSELDLYNGYCLLLIIMNFISEKSETNLEQNELLKKIKTQLFQSQNIEFQLEILENMFALLFLQCKHINNDDTMDQDTFLCNRKEVYCIAIFVKKCLKELKRKYFSGNMDKNSKCYVRYTILSGYVNDALWRLELLKMDSVSGSRNIVNVMLSSPNTLIHLSLENGSFEKAHDVVQVFKMQNTHIAQEIDFMEKMQYLKSQKNENPTEIIKFCNESKTIQDIDYKETFDKYKDNDMIQYLNSENEIFVNIMDIALTYGDTYETSKQLFEAAIALNNLDDPNSCTYLQFCHNVLQVFNEIGPTDNLSTAHILNNAKYPLNLTKLFDDLGFYNKLESIYNHFQTEHLQNKQHICDDIFMDLPKICTVQNKEESEENTEAYLQKLYNYLKLLSQILFVKEDNSNILSVDKNRCIFDWMTKNTAEIVGKLISERDITPRDLEPLFSRLKLDLVYHIAWNCLPLVELKFTNDSCSEPVIISGKNKTFTQLLNEMKPLYHRAKSNGNNLINTDVFLLSYIRRGNWLLAYLINKIYLIEEAKPDTNSDRTKYFNNMLHLESTQKLKALFNDNAATTVLHQDLEIDKLLALFDNIVNQDGDDGIIWQYLLDIIDSIPERTLYTDQNLIKLKDTVLYNLVSHSMSDNAYKYVEYIRDDSLRIKCIFENFNNWPGKICIQVLNSQLTREKLDEKHKDKIRKWYYQIELYENIKKCYNLESWNDIYTKSTTDPKSIFLLLLTSKQILLLLKWIEIHKPISTDLLFLIDINYFNLIFQEGIDLSQVRILLDLLQFDHRIQICKEIIKQIRRVEYLEFIIHYLISLLPELESEYKNIVISLKMFSCFNSTEHEFMYCLISKPLLIIEQLIMNTRLEKLNVVLEKIVPHLNGVSDKNMADDVSSENIDNLLRTYSKKALDFTGIQSSACLKTLELKLMQSLDTVSEESDKKAFVMPVAVPDKESWVQNEEAVECMCCREVTFSMFNRRHHCRRCGRVICGNCSHKRMEIPQYGSIPVRICTDCYKQSQPEDPNASMKSEHSSSKSGSMNCWLLTDDERHNDMAREEFSYEYAPSVSLCLSILKLHSVSVEYPRFLLDQCKILLPYLQDAASEIDFSFVIQMIKSLITVAKITSLTHSFKDELSQCNNMLVHIELLSLLIEKDCLELFRSTNKTVTGEYIASGALRRLRDKLLEQEQWPLALEVSTKAGLDKTGVFAAWGKSCLKSGCLQLAREKFQYCLERNTTYETSLDFSVSYDCPDTAQKASSRLRSLTFSTVSENRPAKTPPLVNDIISVLESNSKITDKTVLIPFEPINLNASTLSLNKSAGMSYDPAICILNKLRNLKNITDSGQGRSRKNSRASSVDRSNVQNYMDPYFYNECLYYLMRYAAHNTILQFYLRHEEIDEALSYILENRLPTEVFTEVYMKCLEDGKIELFQEQMHKIDSSLNVWEVYLKSICRHLEMSAMYNVLYQLQLFMCDYVRAAMTCIKFYQDNANSFRELLDREDYLHRAQAHLKQELEQEQWVQVKAVRKTSTASSSSSHSVGSIQPSLLMKIDPRNIDRYINTIWRQIELTKFLAECEIDNRPTLEVLNEIFTFSEEEQSTVRKPKIPTLFDSQLDKTKLAVLSVVCGKNINEGFGIAFRIIQDHKLKYLKIYCLAGKYLAQILRETAVIELIACIKTSGLNMETVCSTCDEVLMVAICALTKANGTGVQLENLIKLITDVTIKINAYIESKQLKRAYLLAVRHNRNNDIRKILREAERQNQQQIRAICIKRLNQTQ